MSPYSLDGRLPRLMAADVWLAATVQVIGMDCAGAIEIA
jgi:hypothetical protein